MPCPPLHCHVSLSGFVFATEEDSTEGSSSGVDEGMRCVLGRPPAAGEEETEPRGDCEGLREGDGRRTRGQAGVREQPHVDLGSEGGEATRDP